MVAVPEGGELSVQYVNLLEPRAVRRAQLAETKFFDCACPRCREPLPRATDRFLEAHTPFPTLPPCLLRAQLPLPARQPLGVSRLTPRSCNRVHHCARCDGVHGVQRDAMHRPAARSDLFMIARLVQRLTSGVHGLK